MIARLEGTITEKDDASLIISVGGVGFRVLVPIPTLETAKEGSTIVVHTHLAVHDDRFDIFGFAREAELHFFRQLITVRDVGPKSALSILSIGNLAQVQNAIMNEDTDVLVSIPGIGKKTAERIILELREKVFTDVPVEGRKKQSDVIMGALMNLGYSAKEARQATQELPKDIDNDDDQLRWVLRKIGNQQ